MESTGGPYKGPTGSQKLTHAHDQHTADDEGEDLGHLPEVNEYLASAEQRKKWGLEAYGSAETLGLPCTGKQALSDPAALLAVRKLNPDHMMMALKRVFERYNLWQCGYNKSQMDKIRWSKALRDAGLVAENGMLPGAAADKIFHRLLTPAKNAVNFIEFVEGLRYVATAMRCSLNEIMEKIVLVSAPLKDSA
uniref:Uncharacterized protein n=1 Tax=Chlamydomonas leiostraca TaxID=1034604 RepID=A0A7S0WK88_9CHLO|mmetsp:Transcript_16358/g.40759  ORF Transcript_16358/g.40759 Transcript_16358/m.40759 type:complete len:193 (+) Transcript_16358:3-581(+)